MNVFDIVAYISAIIAVGGPILGAIIFVFKKFGPYLKGWLEKILEGFDELSESFNNHVQESEEEKKVLRDNQTDIMKRLQKGDKKFDSMLEKIHEENKEKSNMLDFMNENRNRIVRLEREKITKERNQLEHDKEEFKTIKSKEC